MGDVFEVPGRTSPGAREELSTAPEGYPSLMPPPQEGGVRGFFKRHGRMMWWLHSLWAMAFGGFVMVFAQKGFQYARWLTLSLTVVWLVTLVVFRTYGSGRTQSVGTVRDKVRFHFMTYVLKNFYQTMLFFLLPFYWKTATFDAGNRWFFYALCFCTLLATLDVVFDQFLMRWRLMGSVYYVVALFGTMNLAIPAIYPLATLTCLLLAAGVATLGFWTLNFPLRTLREPRMLTALLVTMTLGVGGAYAARQWVPPVPLSIVSAAVGPRVLDDGRLSLHVTALHRDEMEKMVAVTDVQTPAGAGENFIHVWRQEGREIWRLVPAHEPVPGEPQLVRVRSRLSAERMPAERAGAWSLDVETAGGQLVGRYRFLVMD